MLINTSDEISVYDLKSSFGVIIKDIYWSSTLEMSGFTHLQFKVTGTTSKLLIRLNSAYGKVDEPDPKNPYL
jgi:hypothetical protein